MALRYRYRFSGTGTDFPYSLQKRMSYSFDASASVRRGVFSCLAAAGLDTARSRLTELNVALRGTDDGLGDFSGVCARLVTDAIKLLDLCGIPQEGSVSDVDTRTLATSTGGLAIELSKFRASAIPPGESWRLLAEAVVSHSSDALRIAALTVTLRALWVTRESALHALLPIEAHAAYWRERADWRFAYGATIARAFDLFEGGPVDWIVAAVEAANSAVWQVSMRTAPLRQRITEYVAKLAKAPGTVSALKKKSPGADVEIVGADVPESTTLSPLLPPAAKVGALAHIEAGLLALLGGTELHLAALERAAQADAIALEQAGPALAEACSEAALFLHSVTGGGEAIGSGRGLRSEQSEQVRLDNRGGDHPFPPHVPVGRGSEEWAVAMAQWGAAASRKATEGLPQTVAALIAPLRSRGRLRQQWFRWVATVVVVGGSVAAAVAYRAEITRWASDTARSLAAFWNEHLAGPVQEMAGALCEIGA